ALGTQFPAHMESKSPIASIPHDVLAEIFRRCLPNQSLDPPGFYSASSSFIRPSPLEAPMLLCHVCTLWCSVAIASAALWKSLDATSIHY
ncbi:hypothetical protein C8J57DRAFT_1013349, partial [Mycena rebaudengoi]